MISLANLSTDMHSISLTGEIDTALCVGAGGSTGSLADKPIVRDASGKLLIPASQLKGRLRHECEKIARGLGWEVFESPNPRQMAPRNDDGSGQFAQVQDYAGYHCLISRIFGNPVLPSYLIVDDLICSLEKEQLPEVLRPGVSINRRRKTAEDQKLYLLETSPAHAQLLFTGAIHLLPGCPTYTKPLILAGLHHIHALGGSKSAGLGWLTWKNLPLLNDGEFDWQWLLPGGTA
ncbi:MAG: CRISPR-associated protein Csm3 [Leptolyngbyaceae cyanobacterium SU_3_3]|nr:CRISPR-associated protein Csm3 [Leptolyngbyaceae cyanobacterium SU_3_3]